MIEPLNRADSNCINKSRMTDGLRTAECPFTQVFYFLISNFILFYFLVYGDWSPKGKMPVLRLYFQGHKRETTTFAHHK